VLFGHGCGRAIIGGEMQSGTAGGLVLEINLERKNKMHIMQAVLLCLVALGGISLSAWLVYAGRGLGAMILAMAILMSSGACLSAVVNAAWPVIAFTIVGAICALGVTISVQYPYDSLRDQRRGVKGKFAIDPVAIAKEVAEKQNKK
jgi:hypothetical protein